MTYKVCAVIPTHNHHTALPKILERLKGEGLDVIIVDDGSNKETQQYLGSLPKNIRLVRLPENRGKGVALSTGFKHAHKLGYTHAFQVDADGQHSLEKLTEFLQLSQDNPRALISGHPQYDESIPRARSIGRWFTHVWVWIETLSFRITDSMCGFRVYPLSKTLEVMEAHTIGSRMDFDTEIMVRLFWEGTPTIMTPVDVTYPEGNLSNFNVIADNWRITKMHTKLVFVMLWNLPKILKNRPDYRSLDLHSESVHWATLQERGSVFGIMILGWCYQLLGRRLCKIIGIPVLFYYFLTGTKQRQFSRQFLEKVSAFKGESKNPTLLDSWRHFVCFLDMVLDKFAAWIGKLDLSQLEETGIQDFRALMASGEGGIILVSHLGNMEFCRAVSRPSHKSRLHVLMHSKNSQIFSQVLRAFSPKSNLNIIEVTEVGPDTILFLKERVAAGDWVVIAADRVPVSNNSRVTYLPFLGEEAPFSQGPYILASLLECTVHTALAIRKGHKYQIFIDSFADRIKLSRKNREADIKAYAQKYAEALEKYSVQYPLQWFNFFDFWNKNL